MNKPTLEPYLLPRCSDTKIYLNQPKFTVGRGLNNSFVLDNLQVSRNHCLFEDNGVWCLTDLSSNGTSLNQKRIPKDVPQVLSNGDIITLNESVEYIFIWEKKDSLCDIDFPDFLEPSSVPVAEHMEVITSDVNDVVIAEVNASNIASSSERNSSVSNEHTYCTNTNSENAAVANLNVDSNSTVETNVRDKPSTSFVKPITPPAAQDAVEKELPNSNTFEQVEDELQCIICTELFLKATTLNCSHSFCKHCIDEWRKKNKKCPICRTKITTVTPTIVLDNFISKVLETASDETKTRREELVKSREKQETVPPIIIKAGRVLRGREAVPIEISSEEDSSYNDDDEDFNYDDDEEDYNGVPGAYYGGYGHCYTCGDRGHWANGCPYR